MIKYNPLEDRVLIRELKKEGSDKTDGGIIIPDSAKKDVSEGEVQAIGVGRYAPETGTFIPTVLHKGDIVLFGKNQGLSLDIPDENGKKEEMRLMREGDVLLLIAKKDT